MCVECGTALNVSTSTVADQERAFIRRQIAHGQGPSSRSRTRSSRSSAPACSPTRRERLRPRRLPGAARCWPCSRVARVVLAARRWRRRRGARRPRPAAARRRRRAPARRRARRLRPAMSGGVDTTVLAAFAVGFVSFISPCVLPLVPGYLSAVSGVTVAELQRGERAQRALPAIVFCLCFTVVFVALGHDRHRPRLDAAGLARHARHDRRHGHHRARACCSCSRRSCRA